MNVYLILPTPGPDREKCGVDDFLVANGEAAFRDLVADAAEPLTRNSLDSDEGIALNGSSISSFERSVDPLTVESVSEPVEPFPIDVFAAPIRDFVESVAKALPCPPDFPGVFVLAVLSVCIGRKRGIEIKPGWIEYAVLWVAAVAPSGERKTPAFQRAIEPLRQLQRTKSMKHQNEMKQYEKLTPKEKVDTPEPILQQVLCTDATIEALKDVLEASPAGILFAVDELSGLVRSMSQYKGGRGDDRQHWLSFWSGVQLVVNRKGKPPVIINDPFVSVMGGIQPDVLPDIIGDAREDGFAARMLFAYPSPIPAGDWNENTVQGILYHGICESLDELEPSDIPLRVSATAKHLWTEWVNEHRLEVPPDNLRPFWSKCEGYSLRLALILFMVRKVCNETTSPEVDEPSIAGAIQLINYFKSHCRKVYGSVTTYTDTGRIGAALRWIKKRGGVVTARLVRMHHVTGIRDAESAVELLEDLAALGHGTVSKESRSSVVFRLTTQSTHNESTDRTKSPQ